MSQSMNSIWEGLRRIFFEHLSRVLPYWILNEDALISRRALKYLIRAHLFMLRRTERAEKNELDALERYRLQRLLNAFKRYGGLVRGISELPISTRQDIARDAAGAFKVKRSPRTTIERKTSGTTGMPLRLFLDKKTYYIEAAAYYIRMLGWFGIDLISAMPDRFFVTLNYANPPGTMFFPFLRENISVDFSSPTMKDQLLRAFRSLSEGGRTLIFSYPSDILIFAQAAEEAGVSLPLLGVMLTGQKMEREAREYVERVLNCPVVSYYGNQEAGLLAGSCPKSGERFHIMSERMIVEILDPYGNRVPAGETGDIVLTCLDFRLFPIIRYKTGDRGRVAPNECGCGILLPLLELEGRAIEYIQLSDGSRIPERSLRTIFLGEQYIRRIRQFQIRQDSIDNLQITVVPASQWLLRDSIALSKELESILGKKISIRLNAVPHIEMTGTKFKSFIPLPKDEPQQAESDLRHRSKHRA